MNSRTMKRGLLFSLLIWFSFGAFAQSYLPEWVKYTSGGYLTDIQSDRNTRNLSDTDFKNYLSNLARTNLAKQVRMHIEEVAEMKKNRDRRVHVDCLFVGYPFFDRSRLETGRDENVVRFAFRRILCDCPHRQRCDSKLLQECIDDSRQ